MSIKQTGVTVGGATAGAVLPILGIAAGWRLSLFFVGAAIVASGLVSYVLYRDHPLRRANGDAKAVNFPLRTVLLNHDLLLVSAISGVWAAVQVAFATYIVLFLKEDIGLAVIAAGSFLAIAQLAGAAGRLSSGIISDRFFGGRRKGPLLIFGMLMVTCALGTSALAPGVAGWALALIVVGFGLAVFGWAGIYLAMVGELAGQRHAGAATGLSMGLSFAGVIAGPPLFGYIVDASGSYGTAWRSLAAAAAAATALLLVVKEERRDN